MNTFATLSTIVGGSHAARTIYALQGEIMATALLLILMLFTYQTKVCLFNKSRPESVMVTDITIFILRSLISSAL
jgi:hypothetical protein